MRGEYRALFPDAAPDAESKAGKADLLNAFGRHLAEWGPMLQRFLRDEDDQVRPRPCRQLWPCLRPSVLADWSRGCDPFRLQPLQSGRVSAGTSQ